MDWNLVPNLSLNEIVSYLLIIYEIVISVIAVVVTTVDKFKSRRHSWRISEGALLTVGALGGSLAMWLTMIVIRHKTKHRKFMLGLPAIFLLHLAIVYLIVTGTSVQVPTALQGLIKS